MAALLRDAIKPNLVQTVEGVPAFVHGGPFANIAHGTNSITATRLALAYADVVVTEAGFAFELGAEKFFDINCRYGGFAPACTVLVATLRALKMHGGVPLAEDRAEPDAAAVERGLANLEKHVENIRKFEQPCVVAINHFPTDTAEEIEMRRARTARRSASRPWSRSRSREGGAGCRELAEVVWTLAQAQRAALPAALRLERLDRGRRSRPSRTRCTAPRRWTTPRAPSATATQLEKLGLRQAAGVHRQDPAVAVRQSGAARAAEGLPGHRARDPARRGRRLRRSRSPARSCACPGCRRSRCRALRPFRRGRDSVPRP